MWIISRLLCLWLALNIAHAEGIRASGVHGGLNNGIVSRGKCSGPSWVPCAGASNSTAFADFTTEGTTNHYWYNGAQYASEAAWLTALSGTFSRASTAYYTNSSGLLAQASSNVLRFDYDPSTLLPLGLLLENSKTNILLWSRDWTNAVWTATSATVAKDQTGADGTATSASSILATAGNATVLQSITSASAQRASALYIKRLTGTGEIDVTLDGGSTWTAVTSSINASTYTRVPTGVGLVQTLANPQFGVRIVTNGDKIAVDFAQIESGVGFVSSPIPTTTTSGVRAKDILSFPYASNAGSFILTVSNAFNDQNNMRFIGADINTAPLFLSTSAIVGSYNNSSVITKSLGGNFSGLNKIGMAGNASARSLTANGAAPTTSATAFSTSSITTLYLAGSPNAEGTVTTSHYKVFGFWSGTKISDSDLRSLTAP